MGIFTDIKYVCFMLKAANEQETEKSNEIIKKLKYNFGQDSVATKPLTDTINVEVENAVAWIVVEDKQNNGKDTLYIQVTNKYGSQIMHIEVQDCESITRL